MVSPSVYSSYEVALWFMERARRDDSYLQPQKLQNLLYLSQGGYAAAYHGRMLMPAIFLVDDSGPIEPNVVSLFDQGRPSGLRLNSISPEVEMFLNDIWRSFGAYRNEVLAERVNRHDIVSAIRERGSLEELPFAMISQYFQEMKKIQEDTREGKNQGQKVREETVRTADGRVLKKWRPRRLGKEGSIL